MQFSNLQYWPYALLTLILALILCLWAKARRQSILEKLFSKTVLHELIKNDSKSKRLWRDILMFLSLVSLALATLRPFNGYKTINIPVESHDLLTVFDLSKSMNVQDCRGESRLSYAKWWLNEFIHKSPHDRIGLLSFAGTAYLECPLTLDRTTLLRKVKELNTAHLPVGGTNLQLALEEALKEFDEVPGPHQAILLITDGDQVQGNYKEALEEIKKRKIPIYVIGLGDPHSAGVVVDHTGQRQKDEDQGLVISRSDSNVMQNIAVESGGFYLPFDNNNAANTGVKTVANKLSELQGQKQDDKTIRKANELYQFFLAFGFLCLLLRFFLGERKKERSHKALLNATLVLPLLAFTLQAQQGATNGQEAKPTQQAKPLQLSPEGKKQFEAFSEKEKKETDPLKKQYLQVQIADLLQEEFRKKPQKEILNKAEEFYQKGLTEAPSQEIARHSQHNLACFKQNLALSQVFAPQQFADQALKIAQNSQKLAQESAALFISSLQKTSSKTLKKKINKLRQAQQTQHKATELIKLREIQSKAVDLAASLMKSKTESPKLSADRIALPQQVQELILKSQSLPLNQKELDNFNQAQELLKKQNPESLKKAHQLLGGRPEQDQKDQDQKNKDQKDKKDQKKKDDKQDQKNKDQKDKKDQKKKDDKQDQKDKKDQKKKDDPQSQKDKDKKGQKKKDDKVQENPKNQKKFNQQQKKKAEAKPAEERQFSKKEAEAILRQMENSSKDLREILLEKRRQENQHKIPINRKEDR